MTGQGGYDNTARAKCNEYKSYPSNIGIGVKHYINPSFVVGVSANQHQQHTKLKGLNSEFQVGGQTASLFTGLEHKYGFLRAVVQAGHINFSNITRNFMINSRKIYVNGSTTGYYFSGMLQGGLQYSTGGFRTGPFVELQQSKTTLKSFSETEPSDDLKSAEFYYPDQTNDSTLLGIGWQAAYLWGIQNGAQLSLDGNLTHFRTIDRHTSYIIYAPNRIRGVKARFDIMPQESFCKMNFNFGYSKNKMSFLVGYTLQKGKYNSTSHMGSVGVQVAVA